jgi:hypothetical protein
MVSPYLPHLIYSVALTSISFHLLVKRDAIETERAQISAQISVLESVVRQLRTPESTGTVDVAEVDRLMKLARAHREEQLAQNRVMSWRDVFFGKGEK